MANKLNFQYLRRERALKIDLLAEILLRERILKDIGPLNQASSLCRSETSKCNRRGYYVRNLDFGEIESEHHIRPRGIKNNKLFLRMRLDGLCFNENEIFDPFHDLALNIRINGILSESKEFICCWHLDRHISEKVDNEPEEAHPRYHFQFGGEEVLNLIDSCNIDFGSSLFIDPPRLPHPPLDIVLGIDFVLSNFYGNKWKYLNRETTYKKLVKEAQDRFWKPYTLTIASKWDTAITSDWSPKDIWPQMI
ncbi:MAG: hypothetical protein ACFFDN_26490 [Candidatus Hodarchaeota archaeon]